MRILGVFFLVVVAFLLWADNLKRETIPGSNGDAWTIPVCFILGILGLVCIAAGGPRKVEVINASQPPRPDEPRWDEIKTCPACAEEVKKEAKICRYCSHAFVPDVVQRPIEEVIKNNYFYRLAGGSQEGPVSSEVIMAMIKSKQLGSEDKVLIPEQGWHKVSSIKLD